MMNREEQDKQYGAFAIREKQQQYLFLGLFAAILLVGGTFTAPLFVNLVFGEQHSEKEKQEKIVTYAELSEPPEMEEPEPEPPEQPQPPERQQPKQPAPEPQAPEPPQPEPVEEKKFTTPEIKEDELVTEEVSPPSQEELQEEGVQTAGDTAARTDAPVSESATGEGREGSGEADEAFEAVEKMPGFPGGDRALLQYVNNNIEYPTRAREMGTEGTVVVRFVVERDGSITNIEIAKGLKHGLNQEAKRIVRSMPKWTPGRQGGKKVRVSYTLPIEFSLTSG